MERPAMTLVRAQLCDRLGRQLAQAYRRWRHPSSGRRAGDPSCSGGHPPAPAVSAADTNRPDTDLVDTDRGSGSSSGQPRRRRCPVPQPPRHRPRGPAGAGRPRTRSRRCGATAGPRMSDLLVCAGQVARSTQPAENGCPDAGHRTRPAEHWEPACPGIADARDRRRTRGRCGSGHAGQPAAGPSTTRQPCPTAMGPQCAVPASTPG
jgi:hypothetical protein